MKTLSCIQFFALFLIGGFMGFTLTATIQNTIDLTSVMKRLERAEQRLEFYIQTYEVPGDRA